MRSEKKTGREGRRQLSAFAVWAALFGLAVLIVISLVSLYVWQEMGAVSLGFHGWLALIGGALGTFVLGSGLMALSFYSSRSGHDEQAWQNPDQQDPLC